MRVSQASLSRLEAGGTNITLKHCYEIARALKNTVELVLMPRFRPASNWLRVSQVSLAQLDAGGANITLKHCCQLAQAFNCAISLTLSPAKVSQGG